MDEQKLYDSLIDIFRRADIDLVSLNKTHNHLLRFEILSKGKTLFESKKGLKDTMEGQSYIDYIDFKKYYKLRDEILDKKLDELSA